MSAHPHELPLPKPTVVDLGPDRVATYVLEPADARTRSVPDVVMCHGTPWSAAVWAPVARELSRSYRVFLWDMPGYGASIGAERVDLASQYQRLAALLEHWGLHRPHVLAHDIGGAVSLGAHLLHGRDYASLYLLDVVTLDPWGSPFFRLVADHAAVFEALPPPLHAALVREYIGGATGLDVGAARIDQLASPWLTAHGQRAFYRQIAQLSPRDTHPLVAALPQLRCPARIGWGERDPWIPSAQADELAARLPGEPEVRLFPAAGHLVPLEASAALVAELLAWLAVGEDRHM